MEHFEFAEAKCGLKLTVEVNESKHLVQDFNRPAVQHGGL